MNLVSVLVHNIDLDVVGVAEDELVGLGVGVGLDGHRVGGCDSDGDLFHHISSGGFQNDLKTFCKYPTISWF